jgi:protein-L-isoaspartate(D-aspartate) O-methyltransferase
MRTWRQRSGLLGRSVGRDALLATLRRHLDDERVLAAIEAVPRDLFVPQALAADAWDNVPLPIGCGQTISQPLVVARMCELLELRASDRVLDVGTGSGYHAAVLAQLCGHVWSVERHPALSEQAASNLAAAGVNNVTLLVGDGTRGVPDEAPFDAINVAAAGAAVPPALEAQLGPGGRLVAPVDNGDQRLLLVRRQDGDLQRTPLERVRFVPLI